jgi:dTDP-4-dehydrorhamnose reductase
MPDFIVNVAAYSTVEKAESEQMKTIMLIQILLGIFLKLQKKI